MWRVYSQEACVSSDSRRSFLSFDYYYNLEPCHCEQSLQDVAGRDYCKRRPLYLRRYLADSHCPPRHLRRTRPHRRRRFQDAIHGHQRTARRDRHTTSDATGPCCCTRRRPSSWSRLLLTSPCHCTACFALKRVTAAHLKLTRPASHPIDWSP